MRLPTRSSQEEEGRIAKDPLSQILYSAPRLLGLLSSSSSIPCGLLPQSSKGVLCYESLEHYRDLRTVNSITNILREENFPATIGSTDRYIPKC